jgi:hypothetical protein
MKLQIFNKIPGHYEIIESIIVKHKEIIGNHKISQIYLQVHEADQSFKRYIKEKYPNIIFDMIFNFDFHINCSIYPKHYEMIKNLDKNKFFFISHDKHKNLTQLNNVFYLTHSAGGNYISADVMAYQDKKNMNKKIPIYIIQGHLGKEHKHRRNFNLLIKILKEKYEHPFKIKVIGKGELDESFKPYLKNIEHIKNRDFIGYHKEFLDCYCILPLTLESTNPQYYKGKLTSTINYAKGYKLKCIIDKELQDIYKLPNVETYSNENNIVNAFKKTLNDFYKKFKNKK